MNARTITVESKSQRRPFKLPKPKRWSHQDDLVGMTGKMVTLVFSDGSEHQSVVIDADQFTIKTNDGTFFKHGLRSFRLF